MSATPSAPHDWEEAVEAGPVGPETDGLPVAVMRTDRSLHLVQANSAWHALATTEVSRLGEDWVELFEAEDQERVRDTMSKSRGSGKTKKKAKKQQGTNEPAG